MKENKITIIYDNEDEICADWEFLPSQGVIAVADLYGACDSFEVYYRDRTSGEVWGSNTPRSLCKYLGLDPGSDPWKTLEEYPHLVKFGVTVDTDVWFAAQARANEISDGYRTRNTK